MSDPILVAQLGARMHYAIPRIAHAAGRLSRFHTDICASQGWHRLLAAVPGCLRPAPVRRLLARVPAGIPDRLIRSYPAFGREYARRRRLAQSGGNSMPAHLWAGRRFCELIIADGVGDAGLVYAFNSAALELLEHARARGLRGFVEQTMAPHAVEHEILAAERATFPDWEPGRPGAVPDAGFAERERSEWSRAEMVVCGSEFVRDAIARCGGPVERCRVVPYGVELPSRERMPQRRSGPLRVLVVGAVGLRKGSPYVLAAAKALAGTAVVRMVGPLDVPPAKASELARSLEVLGPVPRPELAAQYQWADVFLLPSLCEGSATVVYEALSWALPVICTPSTGSVVTDGEEGYIVPARSVEAIVDRIRALAGDEGLLARMSDRASRCARRHTLEEYGRRLIEALA